MVEGSLTKNLPPLLYDADLDFENYTFKFNNQKFSVSEINVDCNIAIFVNLVRNPTPFCLSTYGFLEFE